MKLTKLCVDEEPQIMIIPMIDIIFFLLVFFMINTLSLVDQNILPVALPIASSAQASQNELIPITLTSQGNIILNHEEISPDLLPSRIQTEIFRNPEASFILRGDRQLEYGYVIGILDELKKIGVYQVSVATEVKP